MRERAVQLAVLIIFVLTSPSIAAQKKRVAARSQLPTALPCGNILAFQVLLDRHGFSPGQIDGNRGPNLLRAAAAFQAARPLPRSGQLDCATWNALGGDLAGDLQAPYTISDSDANAAYVKDIPRDLNEQAQLPALEYGSLLERLGERFHSAPALIERLNPGTSFASVPSGTTIKVPAVTPFDPDTKVTADPNAGDVTITVSKSDSGLRAARGDGTVVLFAPVTTGSEHDPLPQGSWKVTAVLWRPPFHYNPDLFWDAKPQHTRATIKPGPNNPVGIVWIDLDLEHYGLHGTPEPGSVGHTASHGCVRLTNWDAARVAALVKPGTPVEFR